jgi:hypothetical protein
VTEEETFLYQVQFAHDSSKLNNIEEESIRAGPNGMSRLEAQDLALSFGLGPGWEAWQAGGGNDKSKTRIKITSPTGEVYTSKKRALDAFLGVASATPTKAFTAPGSTVVVAGGRYSIPDRDPPWRTTGHPYIGRRIVYTTEHPVTSRRTVIVDQLGTVTAWLADTDVTRRGQPAYVSTRTNKKPANLFFVTFPEDANNQYVNHLLDSKELEEDELLECFVPESGPAPKSRKKALYD